VEQLVEALRYKPVGRWFDSSWCQWNLHYGPGVDSSSNRKEFQEYFLGGKSDPCLRLTTLPLTYADFLEIWEPQLPETLRDCPGL